MDKIALIKAEIERRYNKNKYSTAITEMVYAEEDEQILSFLSTLESETTYDTQQYTPRPSVDIEDVARVQFASHAKVFDKKRKAVFDWEQFKEVAGIFYGFGKKDHPDSLESEKPMQEGLEKEIQKYLEYKGVGYGGWIDGMDDDDLREIARHFAKWGAEHLKK